MLFKIAFLANWFRTLLDRRKMIQRRNSKRFILSELDLNDGPTNTTGIEVILEPDEPSDTVDFELSCSPPLSCEDSFSTYHLSADRPPTDNEIQTWRSPKSLKGRIT